jgi:hypothetical protein
VQPSNLVLRHGLKVLRPAPLRRGEGNEVKGHLEQLFTDSAKWLHKTVSKKYSKGSGEQTCFELMSMLIYR